MEILIPGKIFVFLIGFSSGFVAAVVAVSFIMIERVVCQKLTSIFSSTGRRPTDTCSIAVFFTIFYLLAMRQFAAVSVSLVGQTSKTLYFSTALGVAFVVLIYLPIVKKISEK